jgi:hypothetical protein
MAVSLEMQNVVLLLLQAIVYFAVMGVLFRVRRRAGIGLFYCALGVMHFLETYLAAVFYLQLPFGIVSAGSAVLFSGKLLMLLLLYIKEDAVAVRQPIYGLLVGNFLIVALVMVLRNHEVVATVPGREPDISFIVEMGWLMVWGTTLLYFDAIGIILLYERLGRWLREKMFLRLFLSSAALLTFDQAGFFLALHYVTGAPVDVLFGGWVAKMGAAAVFSALVVAYLRLFEPPDAEPLALPVSDVFHTLTYRERYSELLRRAGTDPLTGLADRGQFDSAGRDAVLEALSRGREVTICVINLDGLGTINNRHGRREGDAILRALAAVLSETCSGEGHLLFRYGGDRFAVIVPGLGH